MSPENLISSFHKTGIFPFNSKVIKNDQTAPSIIYTILMFKTMKMTHTEDGENNTDECVTHTHTQEVENNQDEYVTHTEDGGNNTDECVTHTRG